MMADDNGDQLSEKDDGNAASADAVVEAESRAGGASVKRRVVSEAVEWAKSILIAFVLALILKATVVQAYVIPTPSMVPTVLPGDRIFGLRFIYWFREPQTGDIVAFKPPPAATTERRSPSFLKRVIATEGDVIAVHDRKVYLNGKLLVEPYIAEPPDYDLPATAVPKGMLFVLGDNRNNSFDSHRWRFLPRKNVQAKAVVRFWPLQRIGLVR
ncbi:MAG: signal peptidase I [bacterium]